MDRAVTAIRSGLASVRNPRDIAGEGIANGRPRVPKALAKIAPETISPRVQIVDRVAHGIGVAVGADALLGDLEPVGLEE